MRADLREPTLGGRAEAVEDSPRDRQLEDAVTQELEPLVGVGTILRPGGVREYVRLPVVRQLRDQSAELGRPDVSIRLSLGVR